MNEQQWQEDVKQFGNLAYLMYELQCLGMYFDGVKPTGKYRTFVANHEWDYNSKFDISRKQSAALPFDKAAAEAGDGIQFMSILPIEWIDATFNSCDGENGIWITANNKDFYVDSSQLRMKHPRRVNVDYSKFEDKT